MHIRRSSSYAVFIAACVGAPCVLSAQPATSPAPGTARVLAEDSRVAVSDTVLKPGDSAASASRLGAVYYVAKGGTIERTFQDGTKDTVLRKTGEAVIITEKRPYAAKNVGKSTIHLIAIRIK